MSSRIFKTIAKTIFFSSFLCASYYTAYCIRSPLCFANATTLNNPKSTEDAQIPNEVLHPNLQNGVSDLQKIYKAIQTYRTKHQGEYPEKTINLFRNVIKFHADYGYADMQGARDIFINPDTKFSDVPGEKAAPDRSVPYHVYTRRPNGQGITDPRPKGTFDVLAWLGIYVHRNDYEAKNGVAVHNPQGVYLVLSDDGEIKNIPFDTIIYLKTNDDFNFAFPGQAGVPPECLTYAEIATKIWQVEFPPIGKPLLENKDIPIPDNGGPEALITFSRLFNSPDVYGIDRAKMWKIFDPAQEEFTLDQIQSAAAELGLPLQKKTITLDELQKLHTPAILYLSDAGRIVTMSTIDDNHAIIYDRGMTLIVSRAELVKRYGGQALISASVNAPSSLTADQPIRTVDFPNTDTGYTQNVTITNHGTKAVSLLIERPLCGITEASLSQDTVAPGASVLLHLELKWRTVLPGDHQSTFVTLKTDDPAQPRLQLGFDLKLAEAAK